MSPFLSLHIPVPDKPPLDSDPSLHVVACCETSFTVPSDPNSLVQSIMFLNSYNAEIPPHLELLMLFTQVSTHFATKPRVLLCFSEYHDQHYDRTHLDSSPKLLHESA